MKVDTSNKSMLVVIIRRLGELAVNVGVFVFLNSVSVVLSFEASEHQLPLIKSCPWRFC